MDEEVARFIPRNEDNKMAPPSSRKKAMVAVVTSISMFVLLLNLRSWLRCSCDADKVFVSTTEKAQAATPVPRLEACKNLGVSPEAVAKSRISGNTARWHRVLKKEGTIKVAVLGGSVTAGHECMPGQGNVPNKTCAWPFKFETMLHALNDEHSHHRQDIKVVNMGRGGTPSNAGITIIMELVDFDVIIINWTANDGNVERWYGGDKKNLKAAFESLIRTALGLPKHPAVIIFEGFGRHSSEPVAEHAHYEVADLYDLPMISARNAFWNLESFHDAILHLTGVHVNSTWHDRFACLVLENWVQEKESHLDMSNWVDALDHPPVFGGTTYNCSRTFGASAFDETLQNAPTIVDDGWSYYADVPDKFGYISNTSNALLQFQVPPHNRKQRVIIHYLKSYSSEWGTARLDFSPGKKSLKMDSRTEAHESQLADITADWECKEAPCYINITNIDGGKVKLVELFLYNCDDNL